MTRSEPAPGETWALPGITIDWLFTSGGFGITRWNCAQGRREISGEKCQRWHVLGFVHTGAFVLHAQGKPAVIDSTAVLLYNPGAPYRTEHPFGCCDHGSAITVRRETLLDVLAHHDPTAEDRADSMFLSTYAHGLSRAYLRQRLLLQSLELRDPMAVESALLGILGEVAEGCSRMSGRSAPLHVSARARRDYVEDTKALLQHRFEESLRLDDIGQALHVSTYHLCRLFKAETGIPIHRYLNQLRLRHALESVVAGAEDLCGLALRLGFASHSHFTTAFRKEYGISPRQARAGRPPGSTARS